MKNIILVAVSVSLLAITGAQAQVPSRRARVRPTTDGTFVAPRAPVSNPTTIAPTPGADGVVPRAIRSGNPLQMLNPFAPAEYGGGHDVVRHDDGDPYQNPRGIKLVAFTF